MSVSPLPSPLFADAPPFAGAELFPISVVQYHAMVEQGILPTGAPLELLEGLLVRKMTILPPHSLAVELTREALARLLPAGWFPVTQQPLTLAQSEPEPDVMIVRGQRRDYKNRHPSASEVGLVVEVADDSLERDRDWKQRIYAENGIPTYWIVNLRERVLEVYREPSSGRKPKYRRPKRYSSDDEAPLTLDGVDCGHVSVSSIFP